MKYIIAITATFMLTGCVDSEPLKPRYGQMVSHKLLDQTGLLINCGPYSGCNIRLPNGKITRWHHTEIK